MHGCQSLSKIYLHFFRISVGGKHPVKRNSCPRLGFAGQRLSLAGVSPGGFPDKSGKTGSRYGSLPPPFKRISNASPPQTETNPLRREPFVLCGARLCAACAERFPCSDEALQNTLAAAYTGWPPHDRGRISAARPGGYALHRLHGFFRQVHGTHPFLFLLSLLYPIFPRNAIDKMYGVLR